MCLQDLAGRGGGYFTGVVWVVHELHKVQEHQQGVHELHNVQDHQGHVEESNQL